MKLICQSLLLVLSFVGLPSLGAQAQPAVEQLDLPELLQLENGMAVGDVNTWTTIRRAQLLETFRTEVYGKVPDQDYQISFSVEHEEEAVLGGRARTRSVRVMLTADGRQHSFNLYLFIPRTGQGPYPTFLGLNFYGNHTVHPDPNIPIPSSWVRNSAEFCIQENEADEVSRGVRANRWPVERIIGRGYALAVAYNGDIDPDFDDGFANGVHQLLGGERTDASWGTIGAWAWGLSRAMDYLQQDEDIAADQVIVMGHSRLGKAALWAGAQDERFAMVISNDSGCGGAALSRRKSGERVLDINRSFTHWFCKNFRQYNGMEEQLPIDQHQLLSLIAPRPLYVASAEQDSWADPYGEYLSLYYAEPVYRLFGHPATLSSEHPAVNRPVKEGKLGYHIRSGIHDVTRYDWERFMDFADKQLK